MKGHRMSASSRLRPALLLAAIAVATSFVMGADPDPAPPPSGSTTPAAPKEIADRLFLSFAQQSAVVPSQWWEGQIEFADGSKDIPVDVLLARGVVAFRPIKTLEVGGWVGFGSTHASGTAPDGTGATDLDIYGKWVFQNVAEDTNFCAGVLVTVPTGDDTSGLGFNSFSTEAFGGVSHDFKDLVVDGHVGLRLNGNGKFQGVDLTGKTSFEVGFSALFPLANRVSLVGEALFESDRFDQMDASTQILAGINWRAFGRGMLRGAVGAGLTNGAPDFRVIASYAYTF
jgi:hypothetical protein